MIRIAHIADIHWRGLSRHDEYRQAFQFFLEDCKKKEVDHIFVGGDIFHTKTTGISPEYIEQLSWWLSSMSQVAPVHLILGNHDGNLVNLSRQDAVSPIVNALNNPRINLYKNSGVYEFHTGYNWCVYSIFDEENWDKVKPKSNDFNIACYHGSVRGSVTETGWDVVDGITTSFFDGYDLVLLGDIHKRQMLGYRNNKPWIGYPGTPIQQNYAEDIEHGYLLWTIQDSKEWDVEFRKIPNLKPYVTISWPGSIDSFTKESSKYPPGARYRIKTDTPISQGDIQSIYDIARSVLQASEVTFKVEHKAEPAIINANDVKLEKKNIRSYDVIMTLIKSYCKEKKFVCTDWDGVETEVKKYLSDVTTSDDVTRGSSWSLRHLKWDNMFAYGENNEIDFSKLNGIVGIFGANRIGKSSIIGTIMYSLFNTTDRGSIKNLHVCNVRKHYCSARSIVDHDGKTYIIERQTTKSINKKGGVNASTALNLFRMNDAGEADDLCGEQRNDTEKVIKSLIGNYEDFLMTSFSAQGETGAFILLSSSRRRALLSKFLDLDIFDRMHEIANKDLNGFKARLKNYPEKDWKALHEEHAATCKELQDSIDALSIKAFDSQNELSSLRSSIASHKDLKMITTQDVEVQTKKVKILENQAKECSERIANLKNEISSLLEKLSTINLLIDSENLQDLKQRLSALESLEKSIVTLRHTHEVESTLLKQQQKSLKLLNEVPCGDDYPTCKFIKDAHSDKRKIKEQIKKEQEIKKSLDAAVESLATFDKANIVAKINKHEKALTLSASIKLEISKKETEIERYKSSCEACVENLQAEKTKLVDMQEALKNEENYEVINLRTKIEDLSKRIKEWDNEKLELASRHGRLLSQIEKLKSEKEARDSLINEMKILEILCEAFSKKGLPLSITKSQLPVINSEISKILQGIVDFTVELENDEDSDSTEIYINYGDSRRIIELCSGMEKTIASIAIRIALTNVSSLPKSDMFVIDEGFGTLDEAGVESCNRLLTSLKKYFRMILVITHVDGIKDIADHVLEITKNEKDSNVVFV